MGRTFSAISLAVVVVLSVTISIDQVLARTKASDCYRAAVLDHVHQTNYSLQHRKKNIELNLKVFESAASIAKQEGADIVVFPENGLIYQLGTRDQAVLYGEQIPNKQDVPCASNQAKLSVVQRLSCLALKHKMFVAADVVDMQPCDQMNLKDKDKCPADKKFVFNTAVLFDRKGTLIAKYHKMHPFGEMYFNVPPQDEIVVVDTELGRLGLQICFDMIYNKPGAYMSANKMVDTMVFPTWWFDEAPFLAGSQYQMAWSIGNKVNLLASNIHLVELGSKGSGIYAGSQMEFENANSNDGLERLVIATVPVKPSANVKCNLNSKVVVVPQQVSVQKNHKYNYQQLNQTGTVLVPLTATQDKANTCFQGVCCNLEYQFNTASVKTYEQFYLLAGNRTRPGPYPWAEEFCALVHCPAVTAGKSCTLFRSSSELQTMFKYAKLTGEFSAQTRVYPSAIGSQHEVIHPSNNWNFGSLQAKSADLRKYVIQFGEKNSASSYPLATLALYGRAYHRDPPYKQVPVGVL